MVYEGGGKADEKHAELHWRANSKDPTAFRTIWRDGQSKRASAARTLEAEIINWMRRHVVLKEGGSGDTFAEKQCERKRRGDKDESCMNVHKARRGLGKEKRAGGGPELDRGATRRDWGGCDRLEGDGDAG